MVSLLCLPSLKKKKDTNKFSSEVLTALGSSVIKSHQCNKVCPQPYVFYGYMFILKFFPSKLKDTSMTYGAITGIFYMTLHQKHMKKIKNGFYNESRSTWLQNPWVIILKIVLY